MKHRASLLSLLLITLAPSIGGQSEPQLPEKAVSAPREIALPVIAYQPECPLKLLYVDIQALLDGGERRVLRYRNESAKPIKSYTIAHVTSLGTGGMLEIHSMPSDKWIMPGKELALGTRSRVQLVPLTDSLRERLNLQGPMQSIFVFMVIRVTFADDSVYDDEKAYHALKNHLEKLSKCS